MSVASAARSASTGDVDGKRASGAGVYGGPVTTVGHLAMGPHAGPSASSFTLAGANAFPFVMLSHTSSSLDIAGLGLTMPTRFGHDAIVRLPATDAICLAMASAECRAGSP